MVATLALTGVEDLYIDLGHVGIYRGLAADAGLDDDQEAFLFDALQRKALPEINEFLRQLDLSTAQRERLAGLATLNGGAEVLERARTLLEGSGDAAQLALENLESHRHARPAASAGCCAALRSGGAARLPVSHRGGVRCLRGGPWPGNRARWTLRRYRPGVRAGAARDRLQYRSAQPHAAWCQAAAGSGRTLSPSPAEDDPALDERVRNLRAQGERVIQQLPGQAGSFAEMGCGRILRWNGSDWVVEAIG